MIRFRIKRIGPPMSSREQQARNPENRGRRLNSKTIASPNGSLLREEEAKDRNGFALRRLEEKIDIWRWRMPQPQEGKEVVVSDDETILLKAGRYARLGGQSPNNPLHQVVLPQDIRLLPITIGILRNFSGFGIVEKILAEPFNQERDETKIAGYIHFPQVIRLISLLNSMIVGNTNLRLPSEAPIDVLFERLAVREAMILILTASKYCDQGVKTGEIAVELSEETVGKEDYTYRYGFRDPADGCFKVRRAGIDLVRGKLNTGVLLDVVPLPS